MSQNVERLQKQYEAFNRRDWDEAAELLDPEVELHGTIGGLEEGVVVRGPDAIKQQLEIEDNEVWAEHRIEPEEFIDAGEQVVVIQREYQTAKGSGVELDGKTATVYDMRDGRIVRMQGYMDPAAALEAVGLPQRGAQRAMKPADGAS